MIPIVFTCQAPIIGERTYTHGELDRLLRAAALTFSRSFAYGDVSSKSGLALSRRLPKVGYRAVQQWCGYSVAIAALSVRGGQPCD